MSEVVKIVDGFLKETECDFLIDYHRKYFNTQSKSSETYNGTDTLSLNHTPLYHLRKEWLRGRITKKVMTFEPTLNFIYDQVVKWPTFTWMNPHNDRPQTPCVAIVYLNSAFSGGATTVGENAIAPETGRMVLFNGNDILHGVTPVDSGTRYTYTAWWQEH